MGTGQSSAKSTSTACVAPCRRGVSLLELLAVVVLVGIFSSAIVTRMSRDILGDSGARSEARRISLGLLGAQRAAIRTGLTHGITFEGPLSSVTSWTSVQIGADSSRSIVEGPYAVPDDLSITVDRSEIWFDFEGNGTELSAQVSGPHRTWELSIAPLTSMIDCREK